MPKFTIERQYLLPVYRHTTYEAPDLAAALALDAKNDDWTDAKHGYDGAGPEYVTYAWKGAVAYPLDNIAGLPIPDEYGDNTGGRDQIRAPAPDMLAALRPFAAYAALRDKAIGDEPDDLAVIAFAGGLGRNAQSVRINLGDCRAARDAIVEAERPER